MKSSKKVTIADIARRAGVSAMTVSRYLSGKGPVAKATAEKLKAIIAELDYQPNYLARSLSSKKSLIIGVTIPRAEHVLMDNYIAQVISGITDVAQVHDYRIILLPFDNENPQPMEFVNFYRSKLVDGLILLKTFHKDPRIAALASKKIPFVLVNHKYYADAVNFVDVQNQQGVQQAVELLYEKGHRQIAFICGDLRETNARDRLNGFLKSMKKMNIPVRQEWIVEGQFDQKVAYEKSAILFKNEKRPTAVIASDDYMAIGVMQRARENGLKIPQDLSIIGFDDIELSRYIKPSLTTVRQPLLKLGQSAANILLKLINGQIKPPVRRLVKVQLVERETT